MNSQKELTKKEILNDPYNYTFEEMTKILGEEQTTSLFSSLYKNKSGKKYATIKVREVLKGGDTNKYLYELSDGKCIETVCIKRRDGSTACISTEVGCPVGCVFCESGRNGLIRNLTASEIVQQVIMLDEKINRIVVMGMGEPLFNYDNLIKALHILRDRRGLDFPTDGITISTAAPIPQLKKFREEHMKLQLTISLHATTQETRNKIMPNMSKYNIQDVVNQALEYSVRHNRKVVMAYLLLQGINDKPSDVHRLAKWFAGKNVMVNILEYNKTSNIGINKPIKEKMLEFKRRLEDAGVEVSMRISHGGNIKAACGQLAGKFNKKNIRTNKLSSNFKNKNKNKNNNKNNKASGKKLNKNNKSFK